MRPKKETNLSFTPIWAIRSHVGDICEGMYAICQECLSVQGSYET